MKLVLGEINGEWLHNLMHAAPASCTRVDLLPTSSTQST